MRLPSVLLLCLLLGAAAPAALGRRALLGTDKLAAAATAPAPAPAGALPDSGATNRIIDGAVDDTNWAYFTAYIKFTNTYCTGSLVGPAHILTAAHCLFTKEGVQRTCADVQYVEVNGVQYGCGTLYAHHDYKQLAGPRDQPADDLGLIGLTTAADVTPVTLATSGPEPNEVVFAAGYGATASGDGAPAAITRMYTDMVVYDPSTCTVPSGPFPDNFCAGMGTITHDQGVSDGGHACHGDSGGPVVNVNGELTGVVSWGKELCYEPYSYYTRVADQLDHINAMIDGWEGWAA